MDPTKDKFILILETATIILHYKKIFIDRIKDFDSGGWTLNIIICFSKDTNDLRTKVKKVNRMSSWT